MVFGFLIILICLYRFPLSVGDRYFARLQTWYLLAHNGDWARADKLASRLDPADIKDYQSHYHPQILQQAVLSISQKTDKTVEDYLEIARIHLLLGQKDSAIEALQKAQELDPVRDDIGNFIVDLKH